MTNQSARRTSGQAAYNVAPLTVGSYFEKLNCFCFTEQTMAPGETRQMAVVFYVDAKLLADEDNKDINTITLSYTFYPVRDPRSEAAGGRPRPTRAKAVFRVSRPCLAACERYKRLREEPGRLASVPRTENWQWPRGRPSSTTINLVNPSPWPVVGSISAFIMAVGAIS